ncbi:MAG: Ribose 1,5-bisphosphate phosphokinase PhnN [Candidatus Heimdallarchaeota archaeon LC_3]|nr:MAG: Ribose 1,5-bisphosphate phosphokinase PhnN [Candidatus Heimdallarchaeota archaeon LC_3]
MKKDNIFDSSMVLFFIGNSGSGKDTIMKELKKKFDSLGVSTIIPKRRITRENHESEKFVSLDENTFIQCVNEFKFILHWFIYGNYYGFLKSDVFPYLNGKHYILMNISRAIAMDALTKFPEAKLINLVVDKNIAIERVTKRKRDTEQMINQRIIRMNNKIPLPDIFISLHNNVTSDIPINVQKIINLLSISQNIAEN